MWQSLVLVGVLSSAAACVELPAEPHREPWVDVTVRSSNGRLITSSAIVTVALSLDEGGELIADSEVSRVVDADAFEITLRVETSSPGSPAVVAAWVDLDGDGSIGDSDLFSPTFVEVTAGEHHVIEVTPRASATSIKSLGPKVGSS